MKTAVVYFSGTGNSFQVANNISQNLQCEMFYLPNAKASSLKDFEQIVLISPIYSFGMPPILREFVESFKSFSDKKFVVVFNYGGFSANIKNATQKFFAKNSLVCQRVFKMKMPMNFTVVASLPKSYQNKLLKKCKKNCDKISQKILQNKIKKHRRNFWGFLDKFSYKNQTNLKNMAQKSFVISDKCISCNACEKMCPTKNILMKEGKPCFAENCTSCFACFHRCPTGAINYKKIPDKKKRYQNPNVNFDKMK